MSRGIIAVSLDEGDELIAAKITNGNNFIFLASHEGMAIRFEEERRPPMGRQARGVRAMDLDEDDYLVGMEVVEEEGLILSIAENGFGKRTPLEDYRLTHRGGKGVINMKTTNKTGNVVGDPLGEGRFGADHCQPERQDHPHRILDHPPGRPLHAGRQAGQSGRRRQGGRGLGDPGCRPDAPQDTLPLQ